MVIEKSVVIEMGHRLPYHTGKCRNIHGHSWKIAVAVRGPIKQVHAPDDGMVVDFSLLKSALKIIEDMFDHTLTLADYDPLVALLVKGPGHHTHKWGRQFKTDYGVINVLHDLPPTSENLTCIWKCILEEALPGIVIASVSVKETATSEAIWVPED